MAKIGYGRCRASRHRGQTARLGARRRADAAALAAVRFPTSIRLHCISCRSAPAKLTVSPTGVTQPQIGCG